MTQSNEFDQPAEERPRRRLSLLDCVCVIAGIIIGIGIFETSPQIAQALQSEKQLYLIWAVGGLLSLCGALCYAELSTAYPEAGGEYAYFREAYGPASAFLFAWGGFSIIRPGSIAAMSFPFSRYLQDLLRTFNWQLGESPAPLTFAVGSIAVLTGVNVLSVRSSAGLQNLLTLLKVVGVLAFAGALLLLAKDAPGAAAAAPEAPTIGLALILVLFCYGGWNEIAYVAEEVEAPKRNLLRALVIGVLVATAAYLLLTAGWLEALGFTGLRQSKAVASDAAAVLWPSWGRIMVSTLICVSALGAVHGMIFTGSRISYALGRDYRLFSLLGRWHPRFGTPIAALMLQCIMSMVIVILGGSFTSAVVYTTSVVWLFFFAAGASIFVLRRKAPADSSRRRLGHPFTTLLFCGSALYVAYSAVLYDPTGTAAAICVLAAGLPLYYFSRNKAVQHG